jgi:hypothetical protein
LDQEQKKTQLQKPDNVVWQVVETLPKRIYWAKSTTAWLKSTGVSQSKERNYPPFPVFNLVAGNVGTL